MVWFSFFPPFPYRSKVQCSSSIYLLAGCTQAAPHSCCWRMDAHRSPVGTDSRRPAAGSCLLPAMQVSPALPLLFALACVCVNTSATVVKESDNMCEETKVLKGIPDATVLVGKIFCYPVPVFAFQGTITQYKVMLLNALLGIIIQQMSIHFIFKINSIKVSLRDAL